MKNVRIGDWVQAAEEITETLPDGTLLRHAQRGGIGHVWDVDGIAVNVTFERTGTTTICHRDELTWLCRADGAKLQAATLAT